MAKGDKPAGAADKRKPKSEPRRNGDLDEGLLESFPASDPPAAVDPTTHLGGGHPPGGRKTARKTGGGKGG